MWARTCHRNLFVNTAFPLHGMEARTDHGLSPDWLLAPGIDLELKEYMLLGYLQRVHARFDQRKLYPYLDELRDHLEQLRMLRQRRTDLAGLLDREVIAMDIKQARLLRSRCEEQALLQVIDKVLAFAIPELGTLVGEGNELRKDLRSHIHFAPVGLLPLHAREGYLLLRQGPEARVYSYELPLVRPSRSPGHHWSVRTNFMATFPISLAHTYAQIKAVLARTFSAQPNPATFAFETDIVLPHIETFMPLAKQLVYEHLERQAA